MSLNLLQTIQYVKLLPIEENSDTNQSSIKDMTIKELKNVLTGMELPTSGNKTKLIQRIVSNQK